MSKKVERVLVQGTVTFRVSCNDLMGLVTPEIANDYNALKDWLEDTAFKNIDLADVEVEVDYDRVVNITEETANKLTNEWIGDKEWKQVILEDKQP